MIINLSQGADPNENVAEFYAHVMRGARDALLAASDWTQTLDAPLTDEQRAAWAVYRQALRDAPANWEPAPTWDAPDPPN